MPSHTAFHKAILPLLVASAGAWGAPATTQEPSPAYAAFLEAAAYTCTGTLFDDVPDTHWACGFIEEFASLNITSGCDASNYCPEDYVTRAQMAVFFVKGLEETLYDQLDGEGSGLDADLLDGQDSVYYLDWSNFINVPAELLDGDDDTLLTLGCASGEIAKWNGSAWGCAVDDTGGDGDITAVTAGTGLSGGGTSGDVTLSADTTYLQRRVSSGCAAGSSIRAIAADGNVTCETDDNSGGDITSVAAGTGLNGGGISGAVTLNVDIPLVLSGSAGISGSPMGLIQATNTSSYGYGVWGEGNLGGAYFADGDDNTYAEIAAGGYGISIFSTLVGGVFWNSNSSSETWIATGNAGIVAYGTWGGGEFQDDDSSGYAYVGYDTYKIYGNGGVSFVQNHPDNADQVIVYTAPEGDEVATYTRGSAKLVNGEARIPLGETFQWVTNPDIGLTAHLTPVNGWAPLYVASKTTSELVVKSAPGYPDNVAFDYIVYGLRIGFEDVTVVQKKTGEARIPSMASHRKALEEQPELARYTALSRWARMNGGDRETIKARMTGAATLLDKIGEFDPSVHDHGHNNLAQQ
ncbi:S-layer homology domain-containing protein [Thiolapillus sp.]